MDLDPDLQGADTAGPQQLSQPLNSEPPPMNRRLLSAALAACLCAAALSPVTTAQAQMSIRFEKKVVEDLRRGDRDGVTAYLLSNGNPGATDNEGQPLLVIAAQEERSDMAALLLHHGARVDASDRLGNTPLFWAAERGSEPVARILIDAGADVNAQNRQGQTPLIAAVRAENLQIVRTLVAAGADPRIADFTGRDAFGWAIGPRGPLLVNELNKAQ